MRICIPAPWTPCRRLKKHTELLHFSATHEKVIETDTILHPKPSNNCDAVMNSHNLYISLKPIRHNEINEQVDNLL